MRNQLEWIVNFVDESAESSWEPEVGMATCLHRDKWAKLRKDLLKKGEGVSSQRQSRFERATRSLATFVRSHNSLCSLTPQRYAFLHSLHSLTPFQGLLTNFTHSLVEQLKFLNICSRC